MAITHNLGFPRIGKKRELKFALENYWNGQVDADGLHSRTSQLRHANWQQQANLDFLPVGDFSLYDHVLDMSVTLGNLPDRITELDAELLDNYFRAARGRSANELKDHCVHAGEMTKWFDTNYHYIVPEFSAETAFNLNTTRLLEQVKEAKAAGHQIKPVIIGPVTYLWLGKAKDQSKPIELLGRLLPVYVELLEALAAAGVEWVQIDEPILVTELDKTWQQALSQAYAALENTPVKILLATYFGSLKDNLTLALELPVAGLHLDVATDQSELKAVIKQLDPEKVLSLGVINGRNIWKTDLNAVLKWLQPIAAQLESRLWLAPSCSLLHVPVDLSSEEKIEPDIKNWLAFAVQKLSELDVLAAAINQDNNLLDVAVKEALAENKSAIESRRVSERVHKPEVKLATNNIRPELGRRDSSYEQRSVIQAGRLKLPKYPTTTIGSFPQTAEIRQVRLKFRQGQLDETSYTQQMKASIKYAVEQQEKLGLDVLVHGEAERNDMVEYFGEQLDGYAFSQFGWVQSYGSRCVKPPILFGDISRPQAMTVAWTQYAQSLTKKPMKGMLTGPVTILNWSFVRDDQPRKETCYQLALAIREEVIDLERAGLAIIQIDEAALREGLPLRKSEWKAYLDWAVESFRITANGVDDKTQIHTHMCYSEFNDIISAIAEMDADVITIETSRSDMELLDVFEDFDYPNQIGPGVYDIHSPNLPDKKQVVELINKAAQRIPAERLWINPDCGLKTRQWEEVIPALENMVAAARELRQQ